MRKIKFNRIVPFYDDFVFTQTDLNQNVLASGPFMKRGGLKTVAKNISNEPCEIVFSYTIKFIDTWTVPLLPYEIQDEQKYGGVNQLMGKTLKTKKGKLIFDLPSNTGIYLRKVDE